MDIQGKQVAIIGLARSGQAAARLAAGRGAAVRVSDAGPEARMPAEFVSWLRAGGIAAEFGGHTGEFIQGADLLVVSPGVRVDAEILRQAVIMGIPVVGELEFASWFCPCPTIAVTGSNGKSTVSTLIGLVLNEAGHHAVVCGNIGRPFSEAVGELTGESFAVIEASSFQLEWIEQFRPKVAVLLNISQNHLDRHKDMAEYISAKAKMFQYQTRDDFAVLNRTSRECVALAGGLRAPVTWFPRDPAANPNHEAVRAVMSCLSVEAGAYDRVFAQFKGLTHRLEHVRTVRGVEFINDSKSTTAEAARWALDRVQKPIVWICGGKDKGIDFSVLRVEAAAKVKAIVAIGEARAKIEATFKDACRVVPCSTLDEAVRTAQSIADQGDCVLLSPMCASFDMFKDFEHRGDVFKQIVGELR